MFSLGINYFKVYLNGANQWIENFQTRYVYKCVSCFLNTKAE